MVCLSFCLYRCDDYNKRVCSVLFHKVSGAAVQQGSATGRVRSVCHNDGTVYFTFLVNISVELDTCTMTHLNHLRIVC